MSTPGTNLARMFRLICGSGSLMLLSYGNAEELRDPTRPPAFRAVAEGEIDTTPQLQSILIGSDRRAAIISGQVLQVGSQIGDARVVRIEADRVVLRSGSASSTLQLFPAVNMQPVKSAPAMDDKLNLNEKKALSATKSKSKESARKQNQRKPATDPSQ